MRSPSRNRLLVGLVAAEACVLASLVMACQRVPVAITKAGTTATQGASPAPKPGTAPGNQGNQGNGQGTPGPEATPLTIEMINEDPFYVPNDPTIKVGTKVIWENKDPADAHTVGDENSQFDSPAVPPNGTFEHVYTQVGKFKYICKLHPWMFGFVTVTAE